MTIYEIFLINSLVIFGVFATTGEGMIFGFMQHLDFYLTKLIWRGNCHAIPKGFTLIHKPLFDCPPCMASLWGTLGFLFTGLSFWWLPVYVFALAGFNYIVNKLLSK